MRDTRHLALRLRIQGGRYLSYLQEGGVHWGLMFAGSRVLALRRLVDGLRPPHEPVARAPRESRLEPVEVDALLADLRRDGAAEGLRLRSEDVAALRRLGEEAECVRRWPDPSRSLLYLEEHMDLRAACPLLADLERDPLLIYIAERWLEAPPVHLGTRMWWSLARPAGLTERAKFGQKYWHYDLHDWRAIKFSFYLTDVGPGSGGTAWVAGSHARKRLRDQLTLFIGRSEDEVRAAYGPQQLRVTQGPAGAGFALDPYTFHMGTPPDRDRLVLQIEFGRRRHLRNCYANAAPLPRAEPVSA